MNDNKEIDKFTDDDKKKKSSYTPPPIPGDDDKKPSSLLKRIKHGSVAVTFIALFIAVILIINIFTTAIHSMKPMYLDMTTESLYTLSDTAKGLLSDITAEIEIVFFKPFDVYEDMYGEYSRMVMNCAKEFSNTFPNITLRYRDYLKDPSIKNDYVASSASGLKTTSVAVKSGSASALIAFEGFFTTDSSSGNTIGFSGEKALTSAILRVTNSDSPSVYFTTGHGEGKYEALEDVFLQTGYTIKTIDLSVQDMPEDATILVIANPLKDFVGASVENQKEKSEIEKVASFLNNFGNVIYFSSPGVGALPEIDDLLLEYGIKFRHGMMIQDLKNSLANSAGYDLVAEYNITESAGDELHKSIRQYASPPKTVIPQAKPIEIIEAKDGKAASAVLSSSSSSTANTETVRYQEMSMPVMALSQYTRYVDNEAKSALLLVCGSAKAFETSYLGNVAFANQDVLLNAIRIMGNRKVPVDIRHKYFESFALDITIEESNNLTIFSIIGIPLAVIALGIFVWIRRRHR